MKPWDRICEWLHYLNQPIFNFPLHQCKSIGFLLPIFRLPGKNKKTDFLKKSNNVKIISSLRLAQTVQISTLSLSVHTHNLVIYVSHCLEDLVNSVIIFLKEHAKKTKPQIGGHTVLSRVSLPHLDEMRIFPPLQSKALPSSSTLAEVVK